MPGRGHRHDLTGVPVIVTENVQDYRNSAAAYLTKEDIVVELGCAQGCSTAVFAAHAKEAIGVDASKSQFETASARYPHIKFVHADAFDVMSILKLGKSLDKAFTVIAIDVSGNRQVGDLWTLLTSYEQLLVPKPRLFIVKSYRLLKLAGTTVPFTTNASLREVLDSRTQAQADAHAHALHLAKALPRSKYHQHAGNAEAGSTRKRSVVTAVTLEHGTEDRESKGIGVLTAGEERNVCDGGGGDGGGAIVRLGATVGAWSIMQQVCLLALACGASYACGVLRGKQRA